MHLGFESKCVCNNYGWNKCLCSSSETQDPKSYFLKSSYAYKAKVIKAQLPFQVTFSYKNTNAFLWHHKSNTSILSFVSYFSIPCFYVSVEKLMDEEFKIYSSSK